MRIHFTRLDLARTYLADGPDPMWELVNSLQALQSRYGNSALGAWRQRAAADLRRSGLAGPVRHRLFPLAPHAPYFPDLLTPLEGALGFASGVDALLVTPRRRLSAEIGRLDGDHGAGAWLADLAAGRARAMSELGATMHDYQHLVLAPTWSALRTVVDADLARRRGALGTGGVEAMFDTFRPMMRWRDPVLELPDHPSAREVRLDGRGLLLVPSYFCWLHPMTIFDEELPQVVVYPADRRCAGRRPAPGAKALAGLLGETRAAVLLAAHGGCTNGELARRLGVSTATISHHTGVLRDAGLIHSIRAANTVRHSLTRLGQSLLYRKPTD